MALYDAFISYSHANDKPLAAALQSVVQKLGKPWYWRRALRVFRDDSSLSATPHLWPDIEAALNQSRYFILLASPEAAASRWVNKEVTYWLDHNSVETLLIGLTDGKFAWDEAVGDFVASGPSPLPPVLPGRFPNEPKWVDLTAYRAGLDARNADFTNLAADFASAIRGMPKEDLLSQEVRQQRRALALAWSAAASLLILAGLAGWQGWLAVQNANRAEKNEQEATSQRNLAQQNEQEATRQRNLAQQNEQTAKEQRDQALLTQSRFLTDLSRQAYTAHDYTTAMLLALEALPDSTSDDEIAKSRPYWAPAEVSLEAARRQMRELILIDGHDGTVTSVAMTPDGSRIATSSYDATVRIWDGRTGSQLGQLKGETTQVGSVAITADGARIVTGSTMGGGRVWDASTGQQLFELNAPSVGMNAVAVTPDGKRIVTGGDDMKVRLWDGGTGHLLSQFASKSPITSVAVTADGSRIICGADNVALVWDARTGAQVLQLKGHTDKVVKVTVTPDGSRIVTGSDDNTARIWDGKTGAQLSVLKGHERTVSGVAITSDGARVVTGSYDNTVRIWDGKTGGELAAQKSHASGIFGVAATSDGSRFVSAGGSDFAGPGRNDKAIRIWDGHIGIVLKGHTAPVTRVAVTPDGSRIITGSSDNTARIWDAKTGSTLLVLKGHTADITAIAVTRDGKRVVTGSRDKTARIWDMANGTQLAVLDGHDAEIVGAFVSPDGQSVITGSADGAIRTWNMADGSLVNTFKAGVGFQRLAMTPDGKALVVEAGKGASVLDAKTGEILATLSGHPLTVTAMALTPDGSQVVTGSIDDGPRIWDIKTGSQVAALDQIKGGVDDIAVTPDGKRIIIASSQEYLPGQPVGIWDSKSHAEVAQFGEHKNEDVIAVSVMPDGRYAISGSNDKTARIWELYPTGQDLIEQAKKIVPRCLDQEERERYYLASTPPRWCEAGQKWPYDAATAAESDLKGEHWQQAVAGFEKAISLNAGARGRLAPHLALAHDGAAWDAFLGVEMKGKPADTLKDALADSEKAVALMPDDKDLHDTRGKIYLALGRTDDALADLDRAIALGLDGAGTFYSRGRAHELKGDMQAAIADYRQALAQDAQGKAYSLHAQDQARARLQALGATMASGAPGLK